MISSSTRKGELIFKVHVIPKASCSEVVGEHDGALRVRIAAPPVDGAANSELIRILAKTFKVSRSAVHIVSGHSARVKLVSIDGLSPASLESMNK